MPFSCHHSYHKNLLQKRQFEPYHLKQLVRKVSVIYMVQYLAQLVATVVSVLVIHVTFCLIIVQVVPYTLFENFLVIIVISSISIVFTVGSYMSIVSTSISYSFVLFHPVILQSSR